MSLEHPQFLFLLLLLIPLAFVFVAEILHTRSALQKLGEQWEDAEVHSTVVLKWFFSTLCFGAFYLFLVLALTGIHWGDQPVEDDRKDLDIVFVIDVSRSMLARDIRPSRLERAIEIIQGTIRELPGLQAGLIAFRGRPVTLVPITADHAALENALRFVNPDILTSIGTDATAALARALDSFSPGSNRHRMVVLLSDGEGLTGGAADLASRARLEGIPFLCIGLGTAAGSLVQLPDGASLTDASGNPVLTRLETAVLVDLSQRSGGTFYDAAEPGIFQNLVDGIKDMQQRNEQEGFHLIPVDRRDLFIILSLVCLSLFVVIRSLRWRKIW